MTRGHWLTLIGKIQKGSAAVVRKSDRVRLLARFLIIIYWLWGRGPSATALQRPVSSSKFVDLYLHL